MLHKLHENGCTWGGAQIIFMHENQLKSKGATSYTKEIKSLSMKISNCPRIHKIGSVIPLLWKISYLLFFLILMKIWSEEKE